MINSDQFWQFRDQIPQYTVFILFFIDRDSTDSYQPNLSADHTALHRDLRTLSYDFDDFSAHHSATERLERLRLQRHEYIKSHLRLSGTSLAELGRELGLKSGTMTTVSKGKGQSKRVQLRIAEALQMAPWKLWPEVFSETGAGE